jgi:tetratricopeptide (TPR) repeat protein
VVRPSARLRLLVALLALLSFLPDAQAQRRSSQESSDREEARRWYRDARDLLEQGDPEAALANFETAYSLYPHWASMIGMGLAYQALGQLEQALVCFEQGLSDGGTDVSQAERNDIESRISLLRVQMPPPAPPPPPPPPPRPIERDTPADLGDWFWGMVGTTGALAVAAIGTGSYTLVLDREYHDPATSRERLDEIRPTGEALQVTTDVLLGFAAAAAVAAVVLIILDDDETEAADPQGVAVTAAPAGNGIGLVVTF